MMKKMRNLCSALLTALIFCQVVLFSRADALEAVPKTGDNRPFLFLFGILGAALLALVILLIVLFLRRRKQDKDGE